MFEGSAKVTQEVRVQGLEFGVKDFAANTRH